MGLFNFTKRKENKAARNRISSSEFHGYDDYFYIEVQNDEETISLEYIKTLRKYKDIIIVQCQRISKDNKEIVTVKCLSRSFLRSFGKRKSAAFGKLSKEAAYVRRLHHPNIVELIEVIDDPECEKIFLVYNQMDFPQIAEINDNSYLIGNEFTISVPDSIKGKIDLNVYPEWRAKKYFLDLVDGLLYLHSQDMVHKDIKPSNLLLDKVSGKLKLVNFGFSNPYFTTNDNDEDVYGTPSFMCPEKCASLTEEYSRFEIDEIKNDIWASGVILYLLVVGRLPFRGLGCGSEYLCSLYHSIQKDEPEIPSRLSDDLQDLLHKLLHKRSDKRISLIEVKKHPWLCMQKEDAASSTDDILSSEEAMFGELPSPSTEEIAQTVKKTLPSTSLKNGIAKLLKTQREKNQSQNDTFLNSTRKSPFFRRRGILPHSSSKDLNLKNKSHNSLEN